MPFNTQKAARSLRMLEAEGRGDEFWDVMESRLATKNLKPDDFRLRKLFEHFVPQGREIIDSWDPREGGGRNGAQLLESGINTGSFANIVGQIVYTTVMDAFEDPVFLAPKLARHVPTRFDGEKIPGVTRQGDQAESIAPADPYPMATIGEEWIETPSTTKRGVIVPVLKEDVFFDRTALVLERAREVSQGMAVNKEKRVIDAVLGVTNQYRKNGAAAIATYGDNSGSHDWDNLAASNALTDYTDIDNTLQLFDGLVDPNTGEPIIVHANQILVTRSKLLTAFNILHSTEFRTVASSNTTIHRNPLANLDTFELLTNQYVGSRLSAASGAQTTWHVGDFQNAFWYMENWPITSVDAPPNSEMEFTRDIVARFKVSERGAIACREPRRVVKCTA